MGKKKKIKTPGKTILVKLLALSDELERLIEEIDHFNDCKKSLLSVVAKI